MRRSVMWGVSIVGLGGIAVVSGIAEAQSSGTDVRGFAARCAALPDMMQQSWPDSSTRIVATTYQAAGTTFTPPVPPGQPARTITLPAHCEVRAVMHERTGTDGKPYAINLRVRLPQGWNGRFLMQGGGGTNGVVGDAVGMVAQGQPSALDQGYAVMAQDSGHDNAKIFDPARGGLTAFGFDPQARAEYGGTSLPAATLAAKAVVHKLYGKAAAFSYFVGCSKGGQEGMMLAQRYPTLYNGIVAAAPGFSLPRAAIAEAWNTQAFAGVLKASGQAATIPALAGTFSPAQLGLVRSAVLDACDGLDGLKDGIVANHRICTSKRVVPQLEKRLCTTGKEAACLSRPQIDALVRIHGGARNSKSGQLYPGFPWDAGWSDMGWRIWMIGSPDGQVPALNAAMGAPALASMFTTPPTAVGAAPQEGLAFALRFDFDRDAPGIYRHGGGFANSAWHDIGARSPDLSAFRARGGRLIVPHGVSDPVFSLNDTIAWWNEVNKANAGKAAAFARVFPVPGMGHCQGGPATDNYDPLAALADWVERGKAPEALPAKAGPASPWPGRERPVCRYPLVARTGKAAGGKEVTRCVPQA